MFIQEKKHQPLKTVHNHQNYQLDNFEYTKDPPKEEPYLIYFRINSCRHKQNQGEPIIGSRTTRIRNVYTIKINSIRIIKTCKTATKETRDHVNQALKVRADRDQCTLILQQLLSACVIFRNHAFQLILHYNCARINFYYKNVHKCILLMKATK